jgi:hypothetical protein
MCPSALKRLLLSTHRNSLGADCSIPCPVGGTARFLARVTQFRARLSQPAPVADETLRVWAARTPRILILQRFMCERLTRFSENHACWSRIHACFRPEHACWGGIHACFGAEHACSGEIHARIWADACALARGEGLAARGGDSGSRAREFARSRARAWLPLPRSPARRLARSVWPWGGHRQDACATARFCHGGCDTGRMPVLRC